MRLALGAAILATLASFSFGKLITGVTVDGTVNPGEYSIVMPDNSDPVGAQFIGTGLDISSLQFDISGGYCYMGLKTAAPLITTGDPTSMRGATYFEATFFDGATPLYYVYFDFADNTLTLREKTTTGWQTLNTAGLVNYAVGTSAEAQVSLSLLPKLPANLSFVARLDGTGDWMDDQISGTVPEPASLALLAMGGLAVLRRNRK
jgi:hypothetical protein